MIYQDQLSPDELYDRIVATKHKEILSPNLSLYYRLPSVDGYDGGLLPLRRFAQFANQFAGQEAAERASDGRLREFLRAVPGNRWLEQMAVRFVVADKTQDVFIDGVFYDLLFSQPLTAPLADRAAAVRVDRARRRVQRAPTPAPETSRPGLESPSATALSRISTCARQAS